MTPEATINLARSLRRATDLLGDGLLAMPATGLRSQLLESFIEVDAVAASLEFQAWAERTNRLVVAADAGLPEAEPPTPTVLVKRKVAPLLKRPGVSNRYVAKDMTCPTCKAKPGKPCVKVSMRGNPGPDGTKAPIGTPQEVEHTKRVEAARQATKLLGAPA